MTVCPGTRSHRVNSVQGDNNNVHVGTAPLVTSRKTDEPWKCWGGGCSTAEAETMTE